MSEKLNKLNRIHFLDEVRGFSVVCMVFYHAFYTLAILFNIEIAMKLLLFFMPAEPIFAFAFVSISGISSRLSKSNFSRGIKLLAVSLILTTVTLVFDYFTNSKTTVYFGVLHMLSCSILIYTLCEKIIDRIEPTIGLIICVSLFFITYNLKNSYIGIGNFKIIDIPTSWYETKFLFPIGLPHSTFISSDYFPIFPWLFAFLAGTYVGKFAQIDKFPKWTFTSRVRCLQWVGKHALIIYILHQPIIYFIVTLIYNIH